MSNDADPIYDRLQDLQDVTLGNTGDVLTQQAGGASAFADSGVGAVASELSAHESNHSNPHGVTKGQVGLGSADNTADTAKPVSTAQATADAAVASTAAAALSAHTGSTSNPHSVTKAQVGLGNADNTSDTGKPVSTAQQAALNLKVDQSAIDTDNTLAANSDTRIASQKATAAYVLNHIGDLVFNIKRYGALCDGSTNDSVAVQSAIDACFTAGGGIVFNPGGTCIAQGLVPKQGVYFDGLGPARSIYKLPSSSSSAMFIPATTTTYTGGGFRMLGFDGRDKSHHCIDFSAVSELLDFPISECFFTTFDTAIKGCGATNSTNAFDHYITVNNTRIYNCNTGCHVAEHMLIGNVEFNTCTVGVTGRMLDSHILGGRFIFCTDAAKPYSETSTVTNKALTSNVATLTTSTAHGYTVGQTVTVTGVDATFNGVYAITVVGSATTFSYAVTHANVSSVSATGTTVVLQYFENSKFVGTLFYKAPLTITDGCVVSGCDFTGDGTAGMWGVKVLGSHNVITGNRFGYTTSGTGFGAGCININIVGDIVNDGLVVTGNVFFATAGPAITQGDANRTRLATITGNTFYCSGQRAIYYPSPCAFYNSNINSNVFHQSGNLGSNNLVQINTTFDVGFSFEGNTIFKEGTWTGGVIGGECNQASLIANRLSSTAILTASGMALTNTKIRDNDGYTTEASGTSSVASGTTSIAVTHGLARTPGTKDISITPTNAPTNTIKPLYVSATSSTAFTVSASADPGASGATFAWMAEIL